MRENGEKCHAMRKEKERSFSRSLTDVGKNVGERPRKLAMMREVENLGWLHCGYRVCKEFALPKIGFLRLNY
jgi:hypothetical protein